METVSIGMWSLIAFVFGATLGSFATMASYRIPRGQDIVFKSSYCPNCSAPLRVKNLFPIFSWMFQRGKCSACKAKISWRYPAIEAALGLAFAFVVWHFGPTLEAIILCLLATELLIMIVIDFEHYIIPDSMQIAIGITGIIYQMYREADFETVAISAAIGLAIGMALHHGYRAIRKKEGLGFGDVKFLLVVGIWLAPIQWVAFLFLSGVIGTLTGLLWKLLKRGALFPFGPALAASLFINVIFTDLIARFAY